MLDAGRAELDAILAADPRAKADALALPSWYGGIARDLDAPAPERRPGWASDPRRLEAARAYYRAKLPGLEGCFSARDRAGGRNITGI